MNEDKNEMLEGEEGLDLSSNEGAVYPNAKVRVNKEQYSLLHLKRLVEDRKEVIVAPDFQREDVWSPAQRSELVESILMGIPLPIIYLFEAKDGTKQVVDGRQRITTILSFLKNEFSLKDLKILPDYNKKNFSGLPPKAQGIFEDYQIFCYVIQPPTAERVKYDIFDRVNRGGTKLNSQEMRNALYHGSATELIDRISRSDEFKNASDNSVASKRMRDKYAVLRIIAFYLLNTGKLGKDDSGEPIEYKSDIDDFLAKVMTWINQKSTEEERQGWEHDIIKAFREISQVIGKDAFRFSSTHGKRRPINMPLMEAVTYLFLLNWERPDDDIVKSNLDVLKKEFDESGLFKSKVDSSVSVRYRYNQVETLAKRLDSIGI